MMKRHLATAGLTQWAECAFSCRGSIETAGPLKDRLRH